MSQSKVTSLENDFGKSESCLLEYNLTKSLKAADIYLVIKSTVDRKELMLEVKVQVKTVKFDFKKNVYHLRSLQRKDRIS